MEKNELSKNARGGTELMQERLYSSLPSELLVNFQIIPSRVRELIPNKKHILWLHDLPFDPESQHLKDPKSRDRFDKFVCVSDYQMNLYNLVLGVPYSKSIVIKNAITPIDIDEKEYNGTINLIYHTTPHRGLEILVPVFEKLASKYSNIHLDVYSSFSIYGWQNQDKVFEPFIERCKNHPQITYHGAVSNEEVREALKKSHIFAFPSIWPETSCLAAIEAMSAKNIVVCPNYAALTETCANFALMYPWHEDKNDHAIQFEATLEQAIINVEQYQDQLNFQKTYFDYFYNWETRKQEWFNLLSNLV